MVNCDFHKGMVFLVIRLLLIVFLSGRHAFLMKSRNRINQQALTSAITSDIIPFINSTCSGNISVSEYNALNSFYSSLNGTDWDWNANSVKWKFPSSLEAPCNGWAGVTCMDVKLLDPNPVKNQQCTIIEISLDSMNLQGAIPASLGNFSNILVLFLPSNQITSTIPPEIGQLSLLQLLFLSFNAITGPIPSSLSIGGYSWSDAYSQFIVGSLSSLQLLYIENNRLQSTIPSDVGTLTTLQAFYIDDNALTGQLPDSLSQLSKLFAFSVADNFISGQFPVSLTTFTDLEVLAIFNNSFTGTLPITLGSTSVLVALGLYENYFTSTIPNALGDCVNMTYFNLEHNYFTGLFPSYLSKQPSLKGFSFGNNFLSGTLSPSLANLSNLEQFWVEYNLLTGSIPESFVHLSQLQQLTLTANRLTGTLPSGLGNLTNLNELTLGSNRFVGSIPACYRNLWKLQILNVSDNHINGNLYELFPITSSSNFTRLINLIYVDLSNNHITGSIPLGLFKSTTVFSHSSNTLEFITPLELLSLYGNCMGGSLPAQACSSDELSVLLLDGIGTNCPSSVNPILNNLMRGLSSSYVMIGTVPDCLWHMPNLTTLHLSGNGLSGPLGDLPLNSTLRDINLVSNYLSGTLPSGFQMSGRLLQLGLGANMLSGTLAKDFQWPVNGSKLDLTVNRFSGDIPGSLMEAEEVSFLTGNMFQCMQTVMPAHDPARLTYTCGSTDFDITFGVWCASICVLSALFFHKKRRSFFSRDIGKSPTLPPANVTNSPMQLHSARREVDLEGAAASPDNSATSAVLNASSATVWWCVVKQAVLASLNPLMSNSTGNNPNQTLQESSLIEYFTRSSSASETSSSHQRFDDLAFELVPNTFQFPNTNAFIMAMQHSAQVSVFLSLFYLFILMPIYISLKFASNLFSTHTYQYLWTTTVSFIHGLTPICLALTVVILSVIIIRKYFLNVLTELDHDNGAVAMKKLRKEYLKRLRARSYLPTSVLEILLPLTAQLINFSFGLLVNFAYVLTLVYGTSQSTLIIVQLALSLYKVFWTRLAVPYLVKKIRFLTEYQRSRHFWIMVIFTYIIGPMLATIASDSNCLFYLFAPVRPVTSTFTVIEDNLIDCMTDTLSGEVTCSLLPQPVLISTTIEPPWLYSYQCSSALLLAYVPVLFFSYLISGVVGPVISILVNNYWLDVHQKNNRAAAALYESSLNESDPSLSLPQPTSAQDTPLMSTTTLSVYCSKLTHYMHLLLYYLSKDSLFCPPHFNVGQSLNDEVQELEERASLHRMTVPFFRSGVPSISSATGASGSNRSGLRGIPVSGTSARAGQVDSITGSGSGSGSDNRVIEMKTSAASSAHITDFGIESFSLGSNPTTEMPPSLLFEEKVMEDGEKNIFEVLSKDGSSEDVPYSIRAIPPSSTTQPSSAAAALSGADKSELFSASERMVRVVVDLAVLLTFGIASPILAVAIMISIVNGLVVWSRVIAVYIQTCPTATTSVSSAIPSGTNPDGFTLPGFIRPLPSQCIRRLETSTLGSMQVIMSCMQLVVIVVAIFWSIFTFDMISDVYITNFNGDIGVIVVLFAMPAIYFLTSFRTTEAEQRIHSIQRLRSSLSLSPAGRDIWFMFRSSSRVVEGPIQSGNVSNSVFAASLPESGSGSSTSGMYAGGSSNAIHVRPRPYDDNIKL